MAGSAVLGIRIVSDSRPARRGFDETDQAASRTAGRVQGHFRRAASAAGGMAKAFAGVAALDFLKDSAGAYVEAEAGQARFLNATKRIPGVTSAAITALENQASALSEVTKFDDDATKSGQAVLAGFKLNAAQIQKLTPLVQDYAEKTGKDMPTAARDLGKALNGSSGPLKKIGVAFKATGDQTKDVAALTAALDGKIGGLAKTAGGTAAGKVEILKNQFGEVQESVGSFLVPALVMLGGWLLKIVGFVQRNITWLAPLGGAILAIVAAVKIWTAVQRLLNFVLATNPIVLITLLIAGLVAGIIIAYQKSQTFRDIVSDAFNAIMIVVRPIVTFFTKTLPGAFMAIYNGLKGAWNAVVGFIKTWGPTALIFLAPFIGIPLLIYRNFGKIVGWLASVWRTVTGGVSRFVSSTISFITSIPGRIAGLAGSMLSAGADLIAAFFRGLGNAVKSVGKFALNIAKSVVNAIIGGINRVLDLPWKIELHIDGPGPLPDLNFGPYTLLPSIPMWSSAYLPPALDSVPDVASLTPGFPLMAAGTNIGTQFGGWVPVAGSGDDSAGQVVNNYYNVTIDGAVSDPDGAARAIEDLLARRARRLGRG